MNFFKVTLMVVICMGSSAFAAPVAGTYQFIRKFRVNGQSVESPHAKKIQLVEVGTDEIGQVRFTASLLDWGSEGKNINDLKVEARFGQLHIDYSGSANCPIILTPIDSYLNSVDKPVTEYKYDFCEFDLRRMDYLKKL